MEGESVGRDGWNWGGGSFCGLERKQCSGKFLESTKVILMRTTTNGRFEVSNGYLLLPQKASSHGLGCIQLSYLPRVSWKSPNILG